MARSRKKYPVGGNSCARSEKKDKQAWHRRMRSAEKQAILKAMDAYVDVVFPHKNTIGNPWSMAKDGKCWIEKDSPHYKKAFRK